MTLPSDEIVSECRRKEESCLYTSTSLYIWLRRLRLYRKLFVVTPIILATVAIFGAQADWNSVLVALVTLGASLFPALESALRLDVSVEEVARQAAGFKRMQDRFRQIANIQVRHDVALAYADFLVAMDDVNKIRTLSLTAPEWAYEAARKKIAAGHYSFSEDNAAGKLKPTPNNEMVSVASN